MVRWIFLVQMTRWMDEIYPVQAVQVARRKWTEGKRKEYMDTGKWAKQEAGDNGR